MATFVQLFVTSIINSNNDMKKINEMLGKLQANGAKIKDIKLSATANVFVIIYEAEKPLTV